MNKQRRGLDLIRKRHPEWQEHQLRWRWLLDTLEGGERYRQAVYGVDRRGLPVRNLIRHKREYPDPREAADTAAFVTIGADPAAAATDDDYELRRARTPVPTFLAEAVGTHLARIYAREVRRRGPDAVAGWWNDVDGCGTPINQWMSETVAPLLLTLGQIDLCFDHPAAPAGEEVQTRADVARLGLDRCLATVILPENLVWWRLDPTGRRYEECLVAEPHENEEGDPLTFYRHWTAEASTLYSDRGEVIAVVPHPFGRVPIVRLFDRRKARCRNVGQSRYEGIAERQREYYNRDSELILSDTTQAHPLLQGPEDYVQPDGSVPVGPGWLLPKKKNTQNGATTYEGFEVVDFPKDGAESIRANKADLRDDVDRDSALVRSNSRENVAQSGLAKMIDHADGNNRLSKLARTLALVERIAAEFALLVLADGEPDADQVRAIEVVYPVEFDLYTTTDVARATADFQMLASRAGATPTCEGLMLTRLLRLCLPGMPDEQYGRCEDEIVAFVEAQGRRREAQPGGPWESVVRKDIVQDINVI